MNPTILVASHEWVACDVFHLHQCVYHGKLVRDTKLLVHIHIGRKFGILIELVQKQRPPELGLLQLYELFHSPFTMNCHPVTQRGKAWGRALAKKRINKILMKEMQT